MKIHPYSNSRPSITSRRDTNSSTASNVSTASNPFFVSDAVPGWATRASLAVTRGTQETVQRWAYAVPNQRISQKVTDWDRRDLIAKAREEYLENTHASGMVEALVRGTVSRLPTFQLRTRNNPLNRWFVERLINWSRYVRLDMTSRVACRSLVVDGESFVQFASDDSVPWFPVRPVAIDSQRIRNPKGCADGPYQWNGREYRLREGILYDDHMRPQWYCVLDEPERGDLAYNSVQYTMIPAECMAHLYEQMMAEQLRGFSWLMQGLETLGRISDYEDAVNENAKNSAGVLATMSWKYGRADAEDEGEHYSPGQSIPFVRNQIVSLPPDADFRAYTPGQPLSQHEPYMKYEVATVGNGMGIPRYLALGSSADYNFASGKLDSYRFDECRWIIHTHFEIGLYGWIVAHMYDAWFPRISRRFPDAPSPGRQRMEYRWPMQPEIDSQKAATTDQIHLQCGLVTRRDLIERSGGDYDATLRQWKREQQDFGKFETIGEMFGSPVEEPKEPTGEPTIPTGDGRGEPSGSESVEESTEMEGAQL